MPALRDCFADQTSCSKWRGAHLRGQLSKGVSSLRLFTTPVTCLVICVACPVVFTVRRKRLGSVLASAVLIYAATVRQYVSFCTNLGAPLFLTAFATMEQQVQPEAHG